MNFLLLAPFVLQGALVSVDEFHFHRKRGLPRWERWGHPLDTLTALFPFGFLLLTPPSNRALGIYAALAAFSCLFVTKDEFVHAEACGKAERWLHANLFLLHPVVFISAGYLWWESRLSGALASQAFLLAVFFHYQIIYWGLRGSKDSK
jgi:hypothetical protein